MNYFIRSKQLNLSSSVKNLKLISKKNKSKLKWTKIQGLDKQLSTPTLKDVVLNPFEWNLDKGVRENELDLNSSNFIVEIN